jgi:hypothetical protein
MEIDYELQLAFIAEGLSEEIWETSGAPEDIIATGLEEFFLHELRYIPHENITTNNCFTTHCMC